jgi:hypothetical protein
MAQPARRQEHPEAPPVDPYAIQRAYRRERARRRARIDRRREQRLAGLRFVAVLAALFALSVFLTLTVWQEIQRLFGL